ncbi:MAG TPA: diguanylate cyclase [Pyrinomonadaceae bacterium]|jgi:diguanylate cyclase (GGDEF)-like protein/putative nucleotidyltransferase with HDIG domain
MSDYNRAAKLYWAAMVAAGAMVSVWGLYQCLAFSAVEWAQFLVLLGLVAAAGSYPIRIPNTAASVTAGDTFIFLSVLFLGVPAAVVVGATDSVISSQRSSRRATSRLGSPAIMALSVFLSGNAFYFALNTYAGITAVPLRNLPLRLEHLIVPLVLMAILQYLSNGLGIAALCAIKNHSSIWKFWRDGYLWTSWTFFAGAIAAALAYGAISRFGFLYVLLSIPVIAATYATYKVYFERVSEKTREADAMSRLHLATVEALATAIDAKDQTTHCHVRRVQIYAAGMGRIFNLSDREIEALKAGALLHDIGKLAVPDHILNKPGRLTAAEFDKMKVHTTVGAEILQRVDFPYPVVPIVRHHHEQWDGHGYPDGLKGDQIPMTARILSVVDCFDSVREDRPFRRGMTHEEASALLLRGAGTHFDPKVVDKFLEYLPGFDAEIAALGLDQQSHRETNGEPRALTDSEIPQSREQLSLLAYDQIKNAHREVYSLYEIARTFGSSLDLEDTLSIMVNKVGHIVPFDTCVVYLYDEVKGYAAAAHVAGKNAEALSDRCVAPGEGVTGFALANRRAVNHIHPSLDFTGVVLAEPEAYRTMAALPLFKDGQLLGALSVYSMELTEYTDDHMRLLETVTRLASDALFNAMHHAEAESNALTDPLTSLPNARCMYLRFEQEVSRASRTNRPFQVIMLDVDEFKQVNDTFGHKVGDKMLREVARLLQGQLREYDFLARYAGDEFVAIVQDLDGEQVEELRQRIETTIRNFTLRVRPGHYARVGISVGASTYGTDGETLDQLLIAADQAMYTAKSEHKQQRRAATSALAAEPIIELDTGKLASTAIN